ncbi:MAG: FHIPEP family type III secretion protein [Leptospiraceae bacterium]|nr:FHIPEP family type III secretion protein [Leptospiraceae bacterium]
MTTEELYNKVRLPQLQFQIGYDLVEYFHSERLTLFTERIISTRFDIAHRTGLILSPISIQDNLNLENDEYLILLRGKTVASGHLKINKLLAINLSELRIEFHGEETLEPVFQTPALWISPDAQEEALQKGLTVIDLETILITHLTEVIRIHSPELQGRQETQFLIDQLTKTHPKVVEEVQNFLSVGEITQILKSILQQEVSILDFLTIMETIGDEVRETKDSERLVEFVLKKLKN